MSHIKDLVRCKHCGNEIKWTWLLPDCRVDSAPSSKEYYYAKHILEGDKYHVVLKCPQCRNFISEYYNLEGKRIDINT